ncbi:SDR family NAD(P)-dependent oxidoreductase [Pseudoponticoccus marisrubri]|uniref:2-deoxy-D-gluconate 3-dehydrogenase n=1 Tax=Pseudoponticoccus marisrubri TaxID=1685382 RepID=A0A0W7WH49_9RHOB|nr:SDR family NAD(P)-dependent oxidoreductase [Pseudoponticoccus marisrubri]KUF09968.1 2-deoxy-D-gluconate 3-dehydrogenase [Pseudoponticoccus marisrubri]
MSDLFDLQGRRVTVTGGTSGIGQAIARAFLEAGARVIITGRSETRGAEAATALAPLGEVHFVQGDAGSEEDAARLEMAVTERLGGLDVLVCAAGTNRRMAPQDLSVADWDAVQDANLKSVFLTCRALYPLLKEGGDGRIITVGSMMSVLANEASSAYAAAKGGVVQFTRSLAVSWAPDGIRANSLLPGWIDTPLTRQARQDIPGLDDRVTGRTPLGRWGTPEEMAGTVLFLAAPASRFVTGAAIPVDGGYLMRG